MEFSIINSTDAMKAKQILQSNGIRTSIGKRSGESGCYYYLKIADRHELAATKLLEKHGLLK